MLMLLGFHVMVFFGNFFKTTLVKVLTIVDLELYMNELFPCFVNAFWG